MTVVVYKYQLKTINPNKTSMNKQSTQIHVCVRNNFINHIYTNTITYKICKHRKHSHTLNLSLQYLHKQNLLIYCSNEPNEMRRKEYRHSIIPSSPEIKQQHIYE